MKIGKIALSIIILLPLSLTVSAQQNTTENGVALYRAGKFEEAVAQLQQAVAADKKDRMAWLFLGASYVKLDKHNLAVKAFRGVKGQSTKSAPKYDTPLKFIRKGPAPYTDEARQNLASGTVRVAIEFGADGKIGFAFPFEELPFGLTENAVHAAKSIQFEPAVRDGQPITVISIVDYSFWTQ